MIKKLNKIKSQINNFIPQEIRKRINETQTNMRKAVIKIRAEMSKLENKETKEKISKTESLFFVNKIDSSTR